MTFVHAPKTIDNDLEENDHTPGFISAGEFVAGAFLSVDLDFRALPGIYVGIVMGRHAGFLTAAASAWRIDEEAGPHLLYVPERAFDAKRFIDDVKRTMDRHKRCIVAVSEGVSTADGRALVESLVPPDKLERDAHGNLQLSGTDLAAAFERMLAEALPGKRARVDTFGFMPRGNIATISPVDQKEAFEAGAFAVRAMPEGSASVALQFDGERTILKACRSAMSPARRGPCPTISCTRRRIGSRRQASPISGVCCRRSSRWASRSSVSPTLLRGSPALMPRKRFQPDQG